MIDISDLQRHYKDDAVFATQHSAERCRERGISQGDIRSAVMCGEIIEQYPDDFPFPSCLIMGQSMNGRIVHVVMSDEGDSSRIITAYYPDEAEWESDCKTRRTR